MTNADLDAGAQLATAGDLRSMLREEGEKTRRHMDAVMERINAELLPLLDKIAADVGGLRASSACHRRRLGARPSGRPAQPDDRQGPFARGGRAPLGDPRALRPRIMCATVEGDTM